VPSSFILDIFLKYLGNQGEEEKTKLPKIFIDAKESLLSITG